MAEKRKVEDTNGSSVEAISPSSSSTTTATVQGTEIVENKDTRKAEEKTGPAPNNNSMEVEAPQQKKPRILSRE